MSIDKAFVRKSVTEGHDTERYRWRCPHCGSVELHPRQSTIPIGDGIAHDYHERKESEVGRWYCKGCQTRVADEERIDMKNATDRSSSFYYGSETEQ